MSVVKISLNLSLIFQNGQMNDKGHEKQRNTFKDKKDHKERLIRGDDSFL